MMKPILPAVLCLGLSLVSLHGYEALPLLKTDFRQGVNAITAGGPAEPVHHHKTESCEAPFNLPGLRIPVGGHLIYEGAGNAYIPAGTVAFWWKPNGKLPKKDTNVLNLSSFQRFYFCRFLRISTLRGQLLATLYSGDSEEALSDEGSLPGAYRGKKLRFTVANKARINPDQWVHVAVTWDMAGGLALYLNGELQQKLEQPWYFGGNLNHIALASSSSSYSKPHPSTYDQSFGALEIYDAALPPQAIAQLAKGETPQREADIRPMLAERARRLGLNKNERLPEAGADGLTLRQVGILVGKDVKRRTFTGADGDFGRAWPLYQGYSTSGKRLDLTLAPGSVFNTVQLYGSGPMTVRVPEESKPLLEQASRRVGFAGNALPKPVTAERLAVDREDGVLFHLAVLNAEAPALFPGASQNALYLQKSDAPPALVQQEFAPYDRTTLAVSDTPGEGSVSLPAGQALHLVGPAAQEKKGLAAIAINLSLGKLSNAAQFHVEVIDPLNYERKAYVATVRLAPAKEGQRLHLLLDHRDLLYAPGVQPWVVLYCDQPVEIDLKTSRIGYQWADPQVASKEFFEDQLTLLNDAFQEISEGRPWAHDPKKVKSLRTLLNKIDALREIAPDHPTIQGYWNWTRPKEETPAVQLPEPPQHSPAWATYTLEAVELFRKAAYWWIDQRQTEEGEFGAPDGINDDTDLIQDWLAIDLMHGPDPKIRASVDKVANLSWTQCTIAGHSKKVTDTLHYYEWGINAQTLAFLLNYGDPVYYERLLKFAKRYPELTTECCAGKHLHFKTWYLGANSLVTEGIYGRDTMLNGLLLQPAMLLAWYNGDPVQSELVTRWAASFRDHLRERALQTNRTPGMEVGVPSGEIFPIDYIRASYPDAVWASYRFTGDESFKEFLGELIGYEVERKPLQSLHGTTSVFGAYIQATNDGRWDRFLKNTVNDATLWKASMHNSNYKQLDPFYAYWWRTGDDHWLDQGSKLAFYHMTWSYPMLTEAEATTDRVWLPQRLANQTMLGGLSIIRNQVFPKLAVSWENATGKIAPLVRKRSRESLQVELCNLEATDASIQARLWDLEAGTYRIHFKAASRLDPNAAPVEWSRTEELARYSAVPLEIPAHSTGQLVITLVEKGDDFRKRPDLAVSHRDARYNAEAKTLTCTIHNIGRVPSEPFKVVAKTADGKELASREYPSLGVPRDYATQKVTFEVPVNNPASPVSISIQTTQKEITEFNNQVSIIPERL